MILRDYQTQAIADLRASLAQHPTSLLQAATGAGKTVIATELIRLALEKNKRVLFLAHRRELIAQTADKLGRFGLLGDTAILMAGHKVRYGARVQVASVDTIRARCLKNKTLNLPESDVVIVDECHRSLAPTYVRLIQHYVDAGARIVGLTATPVRGDGRGLGSIWQDMVQCPDIGDLVRQGHLVPARYYAPSMPDLAGVKVRAGDYVQEQLQAAMDTAPLVGDIVSHWLELASDRPTIVFASGVEHSMHLMREFRARGVEAEHIDGTTPQLVRDDIIARLRAGQVRVIVNCMVLTEGFDCPALSCCVLARPTKSLGLFLQMVGRVLRTDGGKRDALVIDHSGSVYTHGFASDERHWLLSDEENIQKKEAEKKSKEPKPITCIQCKHVYEGQRKCPQCGWEPTRAGSDVKWVDGKLQEVQSAAESGLRDATRHYKDRETFFRQLLGYCEHKGYDKRWANYRFEEKFKSKPVPGFSREPIVPTPEFKRWITHRNIRYAKAKRKHDR